MGANKHPTLTRPSCYHDGYTSNLQTWPWWAKNRSQEKSNKKKMIFCQYYISFSAFFLTFCKFRPSLISLSPGFTRKTLTPVHGQNSSGVWQTSSHHMPPQAPLVAAIRTKHMKMWSLHLELSSSAVRSHIHHLEKKDICLWREYSCTTDMRFSM